MYKNGLVLGKFFPIHLGHKFLIDTAIENCEIVNIIICHNYKQTIPGNIRIKAIKDIYKDNPNVIIHSLDDLDLPQHENECETLDEFYSFWIPEVYKLISKLDVVFTSENYGDDFARYLGIKHFLVDKERTKYPISGTKIREDIFSNWEFIPKEIRPFFVKRIAIVGPESVGKSIMSKNLAEHFDTNFALEYGRTFYECNGNKVGIDDFIHISDGRQLIEDGLIKNSNKLLFCDTEDITTYLFSKMFFPEEYKSIESSIISRISTKFKYDLYILLRPDCESIQDGTRNFLEKRLDHYNDIKNELIKYKLNYVEVGGINWDDRLKKCIEITKSNFNI
jgi:HTH-type transcriptional repressor of NAD biosynthesis genes